MKWASKSLTLILGLALAMTSRPASATMILKSGGHDATGGLERVVWNWQSNDVEQFMAVVSNPSGFPLDGSTVNGQLAELGALNGLSLAGLDYVASVTSIEMCTMDNLGLALANLLLGNQLALYQASLAEDALAALLGVPLIGIDDLALDVLSTDDLAGDVLAALLSDSVDGDAGAALGTTQDLSSSGGPLQMWSMMTGGASPGYFSPSLSSNAGPSSQSNGMTGGGSGSGASGGTASPHASTAAVPLPAGAWSGLALISLIAISPKFRASRRTA